MEMKKLKETPLHKERRKRVGRGRGSGLGKTGGRGQKGQKSRSGTSQKPTFEGGQMPLIRKLPKRGFNNARFRRKVAVVNVEDLNGFAEGSAVDLAALREKGLVNGRWDGLKILGMGELNVRLDVTADKFSRTALEKIQKAGGAAKVIGGR